MKENNSKNIGFQKSKFKVEENSKSPPSDRDKKFSNGVKI